jgi:hypothetical protein
MNPTEKKEITDINDAVVVGVHAVLAIVDDKEGDKISILELKLILKSFGCGMICASIDPKTVEEVIHKMTEILLDGFK